MLRPYQQKAIELIKSEFNQGRKKVLLHLATGGGKTVCFSHMLKNASDRGKKCIMVVRGKQLVEQASKRLFHEGINHGCIQANHWNNNSRSNVQICSIDTLISRKLRPPADLIVIDEAHLATTGKYKEFIESYKDSFVVAVTATPYTKESLQHLAEVVVKPIDMNGLVELGFLVPPRYFAPSAPDLSGVHIRAGDFELHELEERMNVMTGHLVEHWRKFSENRPTVCFAVSIQHSKSIVANFNANGIKAEHIEADHTFDERAAAIERLRTGEIQLLSNVGILCTGIDMPFLSCILMARPTKSYSLFVQQAGRGTRPYPGKNNFILLDHSGNTLRHGFINDEPEVFLEGMPKNKNAPPVFKCPACYAIIAIASKECEYCGWTNEGAKEKKTPDFHGNELEEINGIPIGAEIKIFVNRAKETAKRKNYKKGWAYYRTVEKYGEAVAEAMFPKRIVPEWVRRKS